MKILFATSRFYPEEASGCSKFPKTMAQGAAIFGHKVCILAHSGYASMSEERRIKNVYYREFDYEGLQVVNIKSIGNYDGLSLRDENIKTSIKDILRIINPDIIHFCSLHYQGETVRAAIDLNIPYIITLINGFIFCRKIDMIFNDKYCEDTESGRLCALNCGEADYDRRFEDSRFILENSCALVAPSVFLANRCMDEFDVNVAVMNHGTPDSNVSPRAKAYKKGDKITFGFIGNATMLKGLHVALMAFNRLKHISNIALKVYGDISNDDFYSLFNNENVEFCGRFEQSRLAEVYASFDVLICSSLYYEVYPYIIKEAFALNIPVIASKSGGITESVENLRNGILFERGNAAELASAVAMVAENPELLGYFKRNIVTESGSLEKELSFYLKLYEQAYVGEEISLPTNKGVNDIWKQTEEILYEEHGTGVDFDKLNTLNIPDADDIDLKALYAKLSYYTQRNNGKNVKYAIWGASVSGFKTKELIDKAFPSFDFICYFDASRTENVNDCEVKRLSEIDCTEFDMMFICTQAGKKPAIEKMERMGKKLFSGYLFGWRI